MHYEILGHGWLFYHPLNSNLHHNLILDFDEGIPVKMIEKETKLDITQENKRELLDIINVFMQIQDSFDSLTITSLSFTLNGNDDKTLNKRLL